MLPGVHAHASGVAHACLLLSLARDSPYRSAAAAVTAKHACRAAIAAVHARSKKPTARCVDSALLPRIGGVSTIALDGVHGAARCVQRAQLGGRAAVALSVATRLWCITLRPNSCADTHAPVFSRRCTAAEWVSVEPCAAALSRRTWHACRRCTRRGGARHAQPTRHSSEPRATISLPLKPQIYVLHCVPTTCCTFVFRHFRRLQAHEKRRRPADWPYEHRALAR
jgi:hypothetical protein